MWVKSLWLEQPELEKKLSSQAFLLESAALLSIDASFSHRLQSTCE